jgi:hypothetical protein
MAKAKRRSTRNAKAKTKLKRKARPAKKAQAFARGGKASFNIEAGLKTALAAKAKEMKLSNWKQAATRALTEFANAN